MQNGGMAPNCSDSPPSIAIADTVGLPALSARLRSAVASAGLPLAEPDATLSTLAVLVTTDIVAGLSAKARQAMAIARTCGATHVVLAVGAAASTDRAAFETVCAAFDEFARKLDFSSAVAALIGISAAGAPWDDAAALTAQLAALGRPEPDAGPHRQPAPLSEQFAVHIACIGEQELLPGREYRLRFAGRETTASVNSVKYRLDIDTLRRAPARSLAPDEIGVCTIAVHEPLALDDTSEAGGGARFTLSDLFTDKVVAAGSIDFALRRGMNVHWQPFAVTKETRAQTKRQRPCIVWFTGLSGAGKSTVANLVEGWLALHGRHTYLLDGDNVRHGLNKDLGFTAADRVENVRRVGEVARLFVDAGIIVLCCFISPFRAEREAVRSLVEPGEFIEIHVTAPLDVCEQRDPKGLYAKSRAGRLPNFTGIDSPYEAPERPDLVLDTTSATPSELALRVVALLQDRGVVEAPQEQRAARAEP